MSMYNAKKMDLTKIFYLSQLISWLKSNYEFLSIISFYQFYFSMSWLIANKQFVIIYNNMIGLDNK